MTLRLLGLCLAVATLGAQASAQTAASSAEPAWPTKPVRLVVPTGPGAATDIMARLIAADLSKTLGGSIYVDDLPGASGLTAHQAVARSEPDGYTFLFSNTSGLAINPVSFKQIPYDPTKDFTAVGVVADLAPQMVSVNAKLPVKNLSELIAYARARAGKLDYAVDATAGAAVFSARLFNRRAALGMTEVAFRSAAQMGQDVAAGQIPVLVSSMPAAQPFVDSGDLRQIALFSGRRFPGAPELPTVSESVPGVVVDGFFVLVAPRGTPAPIVERMNKAIASYVVTPEARAKLTSMGLALSAPATPASTAAFIAGEQQRWRDLAKELPIEPQ